MHVLRYSRLCSSRTKWLRYVFFWSYTMSYLQLTANHLKKEGTEPHTTESYLLRKVLYYYNDDDDTLIGAVGLHN